MARVHYREIEGRSGGFYLLIGALGALMPGAEAGLLAPMVALVWAFFQTSGIPA